MKKWIILILVAALLTTGGILGYDAWYRSNHVFVEDVVYEKELTSLDLRGSGVSLEHYQEVSRQLPDCEIRYDLPFQGGFYADDTTDIKHLENRILLAILKRFFPQRLLPLARYPPYPR